MPNKGFTTVGLNETELRHLYFDNNLSHSQIGDLMGCSRSAVQRLFLRYGIRSRTNAESQTAVNITRTPEFTEQQLQLIYGSLLGDACLNRSIMRSNKTGKAIEIYKLWFYHTAKHIGYVEHKLDVLGMGVKTKKRCKLSTRISGHGSVMKGFAFSHTPTLCKIAVDCLDQNYQKRVTTRWLDKLNWQGLAYWYMDDGCLVIDRRKRRPHITFYTQSFSFREIEMLLEMLQKFSLQATIANDPNGSAGRHIVNLNKLDDVYEFLTQTRQFILPCMDYKNRILRGNWETKSDYLMQ